MSLSTILPIAISIVALLLPGILKQDGFAAWINGLISGVVVAVFAGLAVWAGGNFSPDVLADWALFVAAYSALLSGPLQPLDAFLQSALTLPFIKPAPANGNPVRVPSALVMPGSTIPPRASADKPTSAK